MTGSLQSPPPLPWSAAYATEAASSLTFNTSESCSDYYFDFASGGEGGREGGGNPACHRLKSGRVEIPDCTAAVLPCHKVQMTFTELIKPILVINGNYMFTYHTHVLLLAQWLFQGGSQSGKKQLPSPCTQFSQPLTSSKYCMCVIFCLCHRLCEQYHKCFARVV